MNKSTRTGRGAFVLCRQIVHDLVRKGKGFAVDEGITRLSSLCKGAEEDEFLTAGEEKWNRVQKRLLPPLDAAFSCASHISIRYYLWFALWA